MSGRNDENQRASKNLAPHQVNVPFLALKDSGKRTEGRVRVCFIMFDSPLRVRICGRGKE